jgi:hypothetical protein
MGERIALNGAELRPQADLHTGKFGSFVTSRAARGRNNPTGICLRASATASSPHGTRPDPPSESRSLRNGGHRGPILFSAEAISSSHEGRHVLPKDLPNAVKHLNDEELDRLLVVTLAEAKRRGRHTTPTDKHFQTRLRISSLVDTWATERGACGFQGWHSPARIAFGLSQADVRAALKSDK